jgi:tetratricopeptide (TPR) repeat protein
MKPNAFFGTILILMSGLCGLGQQRVIDSLWNRYNAHPADSSRLFYANELSWAYRTIDPDKGLELADKAVLLAEKLGDYGRLATAFNNKGWNFDSKGIDDSAITCFEKVLAIRSAMKDSMGMAKANHNLGVMYFNRSNYFKSLDYQQKAADYFSGAGEKPRAAACLNSIGLIYQYISDYPRAMDYYLRSLTLFRETGDTGEVAMTMINLGILYKNMGNYDKALDYQQQALAIYERRGDVQDAAKCLGNIGIIYDLEHRPMEALDCFHKALDLSTSTGYEGGMASNFSNMGLVYAGLKDYSKALENFDRSLSIYERTGDKNSMAEMLAEIGKAYAFAPDSTLASRGVDPRQRYPLSLTALERSLTLGKSIHSLERQQAAWDYLDTVLETKGDKGAALSAFKNMVQLRDSISSVDKAREITRHEMQFEYTGREALIRAANEKQHALAVSEINRQRIVRNAVIAISALLLVTFTLLFIFYQKRHDAETRKKEAELRAEVAETEMKALRAQMNPHFIFNSLNSIADFVARNDTRSADHYLTRFARLMRMILENSEQKEVTLARDLEALDIYMDLERVRLDNAFSYEVRVDKDLDPEMTLVPPLILQPFVENSIWHGVSRKEGGGRILIDIRKEGDAILCSVEDNGPGVLAETTKVPAGRKSLGGKITATRIHILNKTKQHHARVEVTGLDHGTRVEVRLPLELRF